jgi:hypothetical protein
MSIYESLLTPEILIQIEDAQAGRPEFYTDTWDMLLGSSIAYAKTGKIIYNFPCNKFYKLNAPIYKTTQIRKLEFGRKYGITIIKGKIDYGRIY